MRQQLFYHSKFYHSKLTMNSRDLGYFLVSQNVSNGFRTTLSILLPSLAGAQMNQLRTGLALSLGALVVSLVDAPGPVQHRRNAMLITVATAALITVLTGFARFLPPVLALEIGLFGFFFSMFVVYGTRAASVGTAALLTLILTLDRPLDMAGVLRQSVLIAGGGFWYVTIALLSATLRPYQAARQALGQCIHSVARAMSIKADFYDVTKPLDEDYRHLVAQQVVVSEQQDAVREVLFKSRQYMNSPDNTGRLLVLTFTDVVDLYDQILAMYLDYNDMLERFGQTGVLPQIARLIRQLSVELDYVGLAIQTPLVRRPPVDISPTLVELSQQIDALGNRYGSTLVLKKALVLLRSIAQRITVIQRNLSEPHIDGLQRNALEYDRFVSHHSIDWSTFRDNLTRQSSAFRHSVRVSVALLAGYLTTLFLPAGSHSYWVLLTILVILKPAFSLTKQRNKQRMLGTLGGAVIGVLVLTLIPDKTAQFVLLVVFMLGTYCFMRLNYLIMVVCLTPFLLIAFNFMGIGYLDLAGARAVDTLLGGLIALSAGYWLFPSWESRQIVGTMTVMLNADIHYASLLLNGLSGRVVPLIDYKLARKEVYVASANLAAAFQRMTSEPQRQQRNATLIYEFMVLNHILQANMATLMSGILTERDGRLPHSAPTEPVGLRSARPDRPRPDLIRLMNRTLAALQAAQQQLTGSAPPAPSHLPGETYPQSGPEIDTSLREQVGFVQQISQDIEKLILRGNWQPEDTKKSPGD
ncbi:MAG: FUSC family protein [Spirosoma sp.]|nr:FUSC family protein [Spirosoma sp.]